MKQSLISIILMCLILASCAVTPKTIPSVAVMTSTSDNIIPTSSPTQFSTPTTIPANTPTTVPTILAGSLSVPDPRYSNPELFDLTTPDAPIPQFVRAMQTVGMNITADQVVQGIAFLNYRTDGSALVDGDGSPIVFATFHFDPDPAQTGEVLEGDIPFFAAIQNPENGAYEWRKATPAFVADAINLKFWTQTLSWKLDDPRYTQMILDNANGLVCAGDFEWGDLFGKERSRLIREMIEQVKNGEEPDISRLNLEGIDRLVAFADAHDFDVMVLHLFDSMDTPPDIAQEVTRGDIAYADFEKFMEWYVKTIMRRYSFEEWSVFNEIAAYSLWGDEIYKPYIQLLLSNGLHEKMFAWAHEVAPEATLILNESFRRPGKNDETMVKLTTRYLDLLADLVQRGVPVTKAGIQGHVSIFTESTPDEISMFLDKVQATGVPLVGFTEVTVGVSETERALQREEGESHPVDENVHIAQTRFYQSLLRAIIQKKGEWATFGTSDAYSMFVDLGTPEVAALLLDEQYRPKAAYYGVIQVLFNTLDRNP
jgi:GH35 family endo-1,4-beta-xylanase